HRWFGCHRAFARVQPKPTTLTMPNSPHLDKLDAAIRNPKCEREDVLLLEEASERYRTWKSAINAAAGTGKPRVIAMTRLLNEYKDLLEVELIAARGSAFIKRQKGQLKGMSRR
ncbi:MAG: hypothetical protein ACRD3R_00225, partial [Terriglobales bacterium]